MADDLGPQWLASMAALGVVVLVCTAVIVVGIIRDWLEPWD